MEPVGSRDDDSGSGPEGLHEFFMTHEGTYRVACAGFSISNEGACAILAEDPRPDGQLAVEILLAMSSEFPRWLVDHASRR
jgi:hypothetical protein